MSEWGLEILKTFASPIATIIAATAAVWVTYKFGSIQASLAKQQAQTAGVQKDIAESQRNIAYDRLKYDLFEKRYEVYDAAKRLIEAIFAKTPIDVADLTIRKLRLKLDEARFFFPTDTRTFCEYIEQQTYEVLTVSHALQRVGESYGDRETLQEKQTKAEIELAKLYEQLPKMFERDLGFEQLMRRVESDH
jgi:hypothetical protein